MDTTGEAALSGDVTLQKTPPVTGLEGDDDAVVTSEVDAADPDVAAATDVTVPDREVGLPDEPVVARFADDA